MPKLFLKAEGAFLANDPLLTLVRGWPALTEKTVSAIHFVQKIGGKQSAGGSSIGWPRWADRPCRIQSHVGESISGSCGSRA